MNGSPPRAWGQRPWLSPDPEGQRFTPTGVGTTYSLITGVENITVHPHGRGDNQAHATHDAGCRRFTPTGVGTTYWQKYGCARRAVHPHGRGDNEKCKVPTNGIIRFTPTGVGTTLDGNFTNYNSAVHPHGRGDNSYANGLSHRFFGSPPRAWGQRSWGSSKQQERRFTPTGVGTT